MVLIGNTKQAMSEEESGPVETGLTGLVAMALDTSYLNLYLLGISCICVSHLTNSLCVILVLWKCSGMY